MSVPASIPSVPAAPLAAMPPRASRVLLVDDDPLGLMLTATALREHGFEVVEFDRAQDALDAPALEAVDCVVTDALMPDVDGFEFCRRLRSGRRSRAVPVLMLTSLDGDETTRLACEAGATDHCVKSGNWTLLAHRIRQLVHVGRLEREQAVVAAVPAAPARPAIRFDWLPAARAVRVGHALFRLLDWIDPPTRVAERRLLAAIDPSDRRVLWRAMARMLAGGPAVRMELGVRSRGGRALRLRLDVHQVVTGADGVLEVSGVVRNVTAPEGADPTVARLGHHDPLTGLPNRVGLLERLARPAAPDGRGRGAVIVLEIDRFRSMVDALGQEAADRLVVDVATRLRRFATVRGGDGRGRVECLASLRGDAFALMLDGLADAGEAVSFARRLAEVLDEPFRIGVRECFLRASVGVHLFAADEPAPQRLARAELARRAVSSDGGHAVRLFETAMEADGFDRLEMERDLHYALARGEMTLHYQPQVDALDGRIVGFEALMRWIRGGRVQPAARFIPLAEETGLIVPLGDWAVGRACDALAELRARGHVDCTIAVNVAPRQLRSGLVAARVASELAARDLDPACLEIELTESGAMGDPETALGELSALRALGVGLAVDDFGTGHSSLAYLTRLPLTTLKIDRAFVQDMTVSERSRAVARTIVALGASLHLRVVAEGVETAEQRDALIALGCTRHQGWLYGRALPLEEAMAMLEAPRADVRVVAEEVRA